MQEGLCLINLSGFIPGSSLAIVKLQISPSLCLVVVFFIVLDQGIERNQLFAGIGVSRSSGLAVEECSGRVSKGAARVVGMRGGSGGG